MATRVFVSSTCHDLIDLRAEVRAHLQDLGFEAVLSDVPETFDVSDATDSVSTCLANVDGSDIFVCILSRRYGPRLGRFGFDDVSATHLEYRRACKKGMVPFFYVRDRLLAGIEAWKAAGRNFAKEHPWLTQEDAAGMAEFFDEHRDLSTAAKRSNWYNVFQNSVELRRQLSRHLETESAREVLQRLGDQGRLPQLAVSWVPANLKQVFLQNVGTVAAHDVEIATETMRPYPIGVVSAGFCQHIGLPVPISDAAALTMRWRDPSGIGVEEVFRPLPGGYAPLLSRRLLTQSSFRLLGPNDPPVPIT